MNRRNLCFVLVVLVSGMARRPAALAASQGITGPGGATVTVDDSSGTYLVALTNPPWELSGNLQQPLQNLKKVGGSDGIGKYTELTFDWPSPVATSAVIRAYSEKPLLQFCYTLHVAVTTQPPPFPNFTKIPPNLHVFSHQNEVFARPAYNKAVETSTPWLLFDDSANAMLISPAANFMSASMVGDGTSSIGSGLDKDLQQLPREFTHRTVLAWDNGIAKTYQTWGHA